MRHASIGIEMGVSVLLGLLAGLWLDGRFATSPWLTLIFLLLGIAAAFRALWRVTRRVLEDEAAEEEGGEDDGGGEDEHGRNGDPNAGPPGAAGQG